MNVWSRFSRVMLVLVLSLSLGAHWAVLQTVAWTGMLLSYSRAAGFAAGVSATFDGKHPCQLCRIIKQAREAEDKPAPQDQSNPLKVEKLIAILTAKPVLLRSLADFQHAPSLGCVPPARSEPPPKPPPRAAAATLARSHGRLLLDPRVHNFARKSYDQGPMAAASLPC
jgi:hypothetical protein